VKPPFEAAPMSGGVDGADALGNNVTANVRSNVNSAQTSSEEPSVFKFTREQFDGLLDRTATEAAEKVA
jgi:hypothetical protein